MAAFGGAYLSGSPWIGVLAGALAGVGLLLSLSGGASSMTVFLLAGVVLNTIAGAGVALALPRFAGGLVIAAVTWLALLDPRIRVGGNA